MIALARKTFVHEWRRFMPAVLAIGFSGVLLVVQAALVLGIFGSAAVSVTASSADLWAGYPGTQSVNFGRPVSSDVEMRLRIDPDVTAVEPYLWVEANWHNPQQAGGGISVFVSGIRTQADALMFARILPAGLRARLREPGAVIVDRADTEQLGIEPGGSALINGQRVQLVAAIPGLRALGGVNVLASIDTAQSLMGNEQTPGMTYFVAQVRDPDRAAEARDRMVADRAFGPFEVWTARQFATRSQLYWMFGTGAGIAVLFMAAIVCLVGAAVTSQSFMSVVAASSREYAMLNALGVSMKSLSRVVFEQSCWIGGIGLMVAAVASTFLLTAAASQDVPVAMNTPVALVCALLIGGLAMVSGLIAVRGLLRADPAVLLR